MSVLVFELVYDQNTLRSVTKLDKRLEDTAAVMLVTESLIFIFDVIDALLHDCMLLLARHLLLFHQQFIV